LFEAIGRPSNELNSSVSLVKEKKFCKLHTN